MIATRWRYEHGNTHNKASRVLVKARPCWTPAPPCYYSLAQNAEGNVAVWNPPRGEPCQPSAPYNHRSAFPHVVPSPPELQGLNFGYFYRLNPDVVR